MSTTADRVAPLLIDDFIPSADSLLNEQEWDVYSLLSASYSAFVALPVNFPGDQAEFALHVNALKNLLMSRPVEKELKALYDALPKKIDNVQTAGQAKGEA